MAHLGEGGSHFKDFAQGMEKGNPRYMKMDTAQDVKKDIAQNVKKATETRELQSYQMSQISEALAIDWEEVSDLESLSGSESPGIELPSIELPSIELPSIELPGIAGIESPRIVGAESPGIHYGGARVYKRPIRRRQKAGPLNGSKIEDDERLSQEYDQAGEAKVTPLGYLLDGRVYRCQTFPLRSRDGNLFMLATQCSSILGYQDLDTMFRENRSLRKIMATEAEKEDLILCQLIRGLSPSDLQKPLAIVSAKSVFRQFGSKIIFNGQPVKDDYWESRETVEKVLEGTPSEVGINYENVSQAQELRIRDVEDIRLFVLLYLRAQFHAPGRYPQRRQENRNVANSAPGDLSEGNMVSAVFYVYCDIKEFMKLQFSKAQRPSIGSVIALTGSAQNTQATTVRDYLNRHWPKSSPVLLKALQQELDSEGSTLEVSPEDDLKVSITIEVYSIVWISRALDSDIVEIAQQLAWLGSVFQTSPHTSPGRSECQMLYQPADFYDDTRFEMKFSVVPLADEESSCWHSLFLNPVIAYNFPIDERQFGTGLEIPISMMAALGGASQAIEFDGGIVLKGFSCMFLPLMRKGDCIQWHFIHNEDDSRMPYSAVNQYTERALIDEVDQKSLTITRAFLGWWGPTTTHLGTSDTEYNNIDWSDTKEPRSSISFKGGSIGFQNIIAGEINFSPGLKDGKLHISRQGSYERIVGHASRTPVILYDTSEKRGWLVPSSAVIAHMTQTRNFREKFLVDGKPVEFMATDSTLDVRFGAELMLFDNFATKIGSYGPGMGDLYFRDLVLNIWSLLESVMDKGIKMASTETPVLRGTPGPTLRGWEYMDLVSERSPIRLKETHIQKSNGGWVDFARDTDTIILFGSGFGDIIRPTKGETSGLCHQWERVPEKKDYLAAGVSILEKFFEEAGSRQSKKYLTSTHLQWHRSETVFEPCPSIANILCKCDRLQQIVQKSHFNFSKSRPVLLVERGAVIFGQRKHKLPLPRVSKRPGMRSRDNQRLELSKATQCAHANETHANEIIKEAGFEYKSLSNSSNAGQPSDEIDETHDTSSLFVVN
ncbi:chromatin remodelling complex Rsc7/Swp82 subunit-domain-containing protein [Xylogone sp. PMI_703]|nr:chromatin remodelling complex Rsc7/Swp82 subunit-domain-containing protein [Xylogone sp. PMI_703]